MQLRYNLNSLDNRKYCRVIYINLGVFTNNINRIDVSTDLTESNSLVKGMVSRIKKNKAVFYIVFGLTAFVIITVIYIRYG